jgi:tetratricopeptide (TPR) repeat protein
MQRSISSVCAFLALLAAAGCASSPANPYHQSEMIDSEGQRMLLEAQELLDLGEYAMAQEVLDDLILAFPDYFRAWRTRQEVILESQGIDAAVDASRAEVDSFRTARALTLLARVTEDPDRAIPLLEEAIDLDESYVWAHFGLAYVLLKNHRVSEYEKARNHLEKALHYSSTFREARMLLIECLRMLGDNEKERKEFERYIAFNPDDLDARYNYADLLRNSFGEYGAALDQLSVVLSREPSRVDALLLKAIVLGQAEEYEKAESLFLYLSSVHPDALLNLGLLYMDHLDAPNKALEAFQRYLEYSGQNASEKNLWDEKILVPTYIDQLKKEKL